MPEHWVYDDYSQQTPNYEGSQEDRFSKHPENARQTGRGIGKVFRVDEVTKPAIEFKTPQALTEPVVISPLEKKKARQAAYRERKKEELKAKQRELMRARRAK